MSSDWYARKLSGAPARAVPQAQPQQSYPGTPQPTYLPGMPQAQEPQVTGENIAEVAGLWKGGKATKTEVQRCPNCNGDHFFSQQNVNPLGGAAGGAGARIMTKNGVATTAPRCFDCGYTTAFGLQTGSQ